MHTQCCSPGYHDDVMYTLRNAPGFVMISYSTSSAPQAKFSGSVSITPTTPTNCKWDFFLLPWQKMWSPNSFPRQRDISNDKTIDLPCITTNKCPISYQTLTYHISSNNAGRMPLKQTKGCTLTIINPDRCFLRVHGIWKSVCENLCLQGVWMRAHVDECAMSLALCWGLE